MSNLLELTAKHETLRTIVFDMLDSTVITPETADDLLNAISNSPSKIRMINMTQQQIDYQMQYDLDDHLEQCGEWGR